MNKVFKHLSVAAAVSAAVMSTQVSAYEAGDIIVRAGLVTVAPDESSDGVAIPGLGVPAIAGTAAEVDNDTQLGLTLTYMLNNKFGVELLAATPFSHDITANLDGYASGLSVAAGETKHLPPTLSVIYYPMAENGSALQPYVGAGINYTIFFEDDAHADLEALTGVLASATGPVPLDLELKNSTGLALQVGADYALNEKWHVNASIRWIDIETKATFSSGGTDIIVVDNVQLDPWVYQLNVGYKF